MVADRRRALGALIGGNVESPGSTHIRLAFLLLMLNGLSPIPQVFSPISILVDLNGMSRLRTLPCPREGALLAATGLALAPRVKYRLELTI